MYIIYFVIHKVLLVWQLAINYVHFSRENTEHREKNRDNILWVELKFVLPK